MSEVQADGSTLRQNLEVAQNALKKPLPELDTGNCPRQLLHVWQWFLQLNSQRTSNGYGVNPITNHDMWFFFALENVTPDSWELNLIRALDRVVMNVYHEQSSKRNKSNNNKNNKK